MKFKEHILLYTIVPLIFFSIGASFVRFIILNDYLVSYEGTCDPYTQNCFIGCEDDECTQVYYFNRVQKFAVNLKNQCGENITDCKNVDICLTDEIDSCQITYCNTSTEECEQLTFEDSPSVSGEDVQATQP